MVDEISSKDEGSKMLSDDKNESSQKVTRRKRKKDEVEDMDTSVTAKRPSFPPLAGENLTVSGLLFKSTALLQYTWLTVPR